VSVPRKVYLGSSVS